MANIIDSFLPHVPERMTRFSVNARREKIGGSSPCTVRLDQPSLHKLSKHSVQSPLIDMGRFSQSPEIHLALIANDREHHQGKHRERTPRLTLLVKYHRCERRIERSTRREEDDVIHGRSRIIGKRPAKPQGTFVYTIHTAARFSASPTRFSASASRGFRP